MAISVRDIQEKEFATQVSGGYNIEQVDDFLDEISEQMAALVRENMELGQQVKALQADVQAAESKLPDYNEKDYFQNLQNAMRESLIGAQRIADETTEDANRKAEKTIADAQAQADEITGAAQEKADALIAKAQKEAEELTAGTKAKLETLQARFDALKASATSYKAEFSRVLEQQAAALKESNGLF